MRKEWPLFKPSIKLSVEPKVIIARVERAVNRQELERLGEYDVYVGWASDARAVTDEDGKTVSIAVYAKANNYGTYTKAGNGKRVRIPARPFVTFAMNNEKYVDQREEVVQQGAKAIRKRQLTAKDVLSLLGMKGVENIRHSIKFGPWKENSASTLIRKLAKAHGKDNGEAPRPLIDTGQMIDRVTYVVKERDK